MPRPRPRRPSRPKRPPRAVGRARRTSTNRRSIRPRSSPRKRSPGRRRPRTPESAPSAAVSSSGLQREVFGFLPYWELSDSSTTLDYAKISTIAYFGVGADATGNLQKRNTDGTTTVGWSGWTSSRMTNLINTAHAEPHARRADRPELRLDAGRLDRQKALLGSATARANLAKTGRRRRPRPRRRRRQPRLRADRLRLRGRVRRRSSGASGPSSNNVALGLPADVRHARATSATTRSRRDRPGRRRRDLHHGLRLPDRGRPARSARSRRCRGPATTSATRSSAYTARVPASKLILGVPYYGRAWSTNSDDLHATNISGTKYGASTTVVYEHGDRLPRGARPALRRDRGRGLDRLPARELHRDLRLRHAVAPALLDDAQALRGQVRPRQQQRPARRRHLGARLRRDPDRAVEGDRRQVRRRT